MPGSPDVNQAALVLTAIPETLCYDSFLEFVKDIPNIFALKLPSSTLSNVIISPTQPGDSETNALWVRQNNDFSFQGIYIFAQGQWNPLFPVNVSQPVLTTQVFWFAGDSAQPPRGYINTDASLILSTTVKNALKDLWVLEGPTYTYYSATFTGY